MIAEVLLIAAAIHLLLGVGFAIPFVLVGVGKIDPHAARGSWGFRLLIVPGTMFLWPLLALRWAKGIHEPPEERSPHRRAARNSCKNAAHAKSPITCQMACPSENQSLVTPAAPGKGKGATA